MSRARAKTYIPRDARPPRERCVRARADMCVCVCVLCRVIKWGRKIMAGMRDNDRRRRNNFGVPSVSFHFHGNDVESVRRDSVRSTEVWAPYTHEFPEPQSIRSRDCSSDCFSSWMVVEGRKWIERTRSSHVGYTRANKRKRERERSASIIVNNRARKNNWAYVLYSYDSIRGRKEETVSKSLAIANV